MEKLTQKLTQGDIGTNNGLLKAHTGIQGLDEVTGGASLAAGLR